MTQMFFGRPHGPFRIGLALLCPVVIVILLVTVARLNTRFANQQQVNETSLTAANAVVAVNKKVTARVAQLGTLTDNAQGALGEAQAIQPLLAQLHTALEPVVGGVGSASAGASVSEATISTITQVIAALAAKFKVVVVSAQQFGSEEQQLIGTLPGMVIDLKAAVADAARIQSALPAVLGAGG